MNEIHKWWGYICLDGQIMVKKVSPATPAELKDIQSSRFVRTIYEPFDASGRIDALNYIGKHLENHPKS